MDKYNYIKNPLTNRNVRTDGKLGKSIIEKYVKNMIGGVLHYDMRNKVWTGDINEECPICFEKLSERDEEINPSGDIVILRDCGHTFHKRCIENALGRQPGRCPLRCQVVTTDDPLLTIARVEPTGTVTSLIEQTAPRAPPIPGIGVAIVEPVRPEQGEQAGPVGEEPAEIDDLERLQAGLLESYQQERDERQAREEEERVKEQQARRFLARVNPQQRFRGDGTKRYFGYRAELLHRGPVLEEARPTTRPRLVVTRRPTVPTVIRGERTLQTPEESERAARHLTAVERAEYQRKKAESDRRFQAMEDRARIRRERVAAQARSAEEARLAERRQLRAAAAERRKEQADIDREDWYTPDSTPRGDQWYTPDSTPRSEGGGRRKNKKHTKKR